MSSFSQIMHRVSLLVCLYLSFSCRAFVLDLYHMTDEGWLLCVLLEFAFYDVYTFRVLLLLISDFHCSLSHIVQICLISLFNIVSTSPICSFTSSKYFMLTLIHFVLMLSCVVLSLVVYFSRTFFSWSLFRCWLSMFSSKMLQFRFSGLGLVHSLVHPV